MKRIRVVEQCHDYEPQSFYIDPDKLNPEAPIDSLVIKELKKSPKKKEISIFVDASNWEDDPFFKADVWAEPELTNECRTDKGEIEDKIIWLTIDFEG